MSGGVRKRGALICRVGHVIQETPKRPRNPFPGRGPNRGTLPGHFQAVEVRFCLPIPLKRAEMAQTTYSRFGSLGDGHTQKKAQPPDCLRKSSRVPWCVHPQRVRFASFFRSLSLKSGRMRGASMAIALCCVGMAACAVHPGAGLGGNIARNSLQQPRTLRLKGGGLPFGLGTAKDTRDYKTVLEESQGRLPVAPRGASPTQRRTPRFSILSWTKLGKP